MSTEIKNQPTLDELTALSPIDGRYGSKTAFLRPLLSEYGLIRSRVEIEVLWVQKLIYELHLTDRVKIEAIKNQLNRIIESFTAEDAEIVKSLEKTTNHDVKAVEYYLRDNFREDKLLIPLAPYIHFGCTSEDINNLAYSAILKKTRDSFILPSINSLCKTLRLLAKDFAATSMLSRTHGQPASPTTMGKEIANFVHRLESQSTQLSNIDFKGKLNGAVGNYNAFHISHPEIDWPKISAEFIRESGL